MIFSKGFKTKQKLKNFAKKRRRFVSYFFSHRISSCFKITKKNHYITIKCNFLINHLAAFDVWDIISSCIPSRLYILI